MNLGKITRIAKRGDPIASLICGLAAENGWSCEKNASVAEEWYQKAANDLPLARYLLAKLIARHTDRASEAVDLAKEAAEAGIAEAASFLGAYYEYGIEADRDEEKANEWMERALSLGDTGALADKGHRLVDINGKISEPEQALAYFLSAAEAGHLPAKSVIARIYLEYTDPPKKERAFNLLHDAAEQGDWGALRELSRIHRYGLFGEAKNPTLAEKYSTAADQVHADWTLTWS